VHQLLGHDIYFCEKPGRCVSYSDRSELTKLASHNGAQDARQRVAPPKQEPTLLCAQAVQAWYAAQGEIQ